MCTRLRSSLDFNLLSPAARRWCLSAATSTSGGGTTGGDVAFRFPRASRDRTVFDDREQQQKRRQGHNNTDSTQVRASTRFESRVWPMAVYGFRLKTLWPQTKPLWAQMPHPMAVHAVPKTEDPVTLWPGDPYPA